MIAAADGWMYCTVHTVYTGPCTACTDDERRDGCSATEMLVAYARHGPSPCERGEEGKSEVEGYRYKAT